MKKINLVKIFNTVFLAIILFVAILIILSSFKIAFLKILVIKSGSMEPALKKEGVVFTWPKESYKVGDIISYEISGGKGTVTHRINEIKYDNNQIKYVTKGDANPAPDQEKVTKAQIIGRVLFSVPYLGHVISFSKTLPGLIILIIIPATIIVYEELKNIIKEIKKRKAK